jgi:hypothetical protein
MSGRREGVWVFLILAGFAAVCMWIVLRLGGGEPEYPAASTYAPTKEGAKALYELLVAAGIPAQRYGDTEYEYPKEACVLLVEESQVDMAQAMGGQLNVKALAVWLRAGGRLVLACPPPDSYYSPVDPTARKLVGYLDGEDVGNGGMFDVAPPVPSSAQQNASEAPGALAHAVYQAAGQAGSNTATYRAYRPGQRFKLQSPRPRLFADVGMIETADGSPASVPTMVPLLTAGDPAQPVVLYRRVGRGELYWISRPEIFSNSWIARADNHRLVLALLKYAARDRTLYIDEHTHGYSRQRANAGSLLFKTLGGQLILAAGFAMALCFCGAAVRPARYQPQPVPPRRTAAEMVEAQAGLFRRAGIRRGIVERLLDGVRRAYMHTYSHNMTPSNELLQSWVRKYSIDGVQQARLLSAYLVATSAPSGQAELVRLGRACDWARQQLEKERHE